MKFTMILMTILTLLFMSVPTQATVRLVPGGYRFIQDALDACDAGDTVLVSRGEHIVSDSLVFPRDNITLTSRFIQDHDPRTIDETQIAGTWGHKVLHITRDARVIGFTIMRGRARSGGGGGIKISAADVSLEHLVVLGNLSDTQGGGIYITGNCEPTLIDVVLKENVATQDGGGIFCNSSDLRINKVTLTQNNAERKGGGMFIDGSCVVTASRILAYGNGADIGGGIYLSSGSASTYDRMTVLYNATDDDASGGIHIDDGDVTLVNSIIWQNGVRTIYVPNAYRDELSILYCDILGGQEDIIAPENYVNWGEGNIDRNPMFVNQQEDDYSIRDNSPCVDAGDPDSSPDPDGTNADIGYYSIFQTASIYGYVYDAQTREPINASKVTAEYAASSRFAETNGDGRWIINETTVGEFSVTATAYAYNDSTLFGFNVEPDEELQVDTIFLLHPTFDMEFEGVNTTIEPSDSTDYSLTLINSGNGPLYWSVDKKITGEGAVEPWTELENFAVGDTVKDDKMGGVVLAGDYFYVSGGSPSDIEHGGITDSTDYNYIYVFDREGNLVNYFRQFTDDRNGMADLAYDGELIWGAEDDVLYGFTTDGDSVIAFDVPSSQGITWDSDREVFWVCDQLGDIDAVDRDGAVVRTIDGFGLSKRGLAYYPEDPDGYPLYLFYKITIDRIPFEYIIKIDPDANDGEGDTLFVVQTMPQDGRGSEGAFITSEYDDIGSWTFIGLTSILPAYGNDRVYVYHIQSYSEWVRLDPYPTTMDTLIPGTEKNFMLYLNTIGPNGRFILPNQLYEAELTFTHNADGLERIIPIAMNVSPNAVDDVNVSIPDNFAITSIYPNPFNSTAIVRFTLPMQDRVTVELYDVQGRLVSLIEDNTFTAGNHQTQISAESC